MRKKFFPDIGVLTDSGVYPSTKADSSTGKKPLDFRHRKALTCLFFCRKFSIFRGTPQGAKQNKTYFYNIRIKKPFVKR